MTVSSRPPALSITYAHERVQDAARVEALVEHAFGPGRFAKAAERLREGAEPDRSLSFLAWAGEEAVGCVRLWPIAIGDTPALLLGPFAVEDAWRSRGLGAALIEQAVAEARAQGRNLILLVGDEPFFQRFGFRPAPAGRVTMPGPVDPRRVLWLDPRTGEEPVAKGPVKARV